MAYQYQCDDGIEPVSDSFGEQVGNAAAYNVFSGNAVTYSLTDMVVTAAAGTITNNFATLNTVQDTVTLIADPTNPRWTWVGRDATGDLVKVEGDPAQYPAVPELGDNTGLALVLVQAGQTIADNIVTRLDKRTPAQSVARYKAATQVFTSSTDLLDVITSGTATASFYADVNGVYVVEYQIPFTYTGTGGLKLQIAGPSSSSSLAIMAQSGMVYDGTVYQTLSEALVAAFATNFVARNTGASSGNFNDGAGGPLVRAQVLLRNGATAGNVTLQAAQNSANGTTTLGLGFAMTVRRLA